jgi:hypothetical protein
MFSSMPPAGKRWLCGQEGNKRAAGLRLNGCLKEKPEGETSGALPALKAQLHCTVHQDPRRAHAKMKMPDFSIEGWKEPGGWLACIYHTGHRCSKAFQPPHLV